VPISKTTLDRCIESADYWAKYLPIVTYYNRQREKRFAIAAAFFSTLTGLGVWAILQTSTQWPAVLLISLVSGASALVVLIPQIAGYAETAEKAMFLCPKYGSVLGQLHDAKAMVEKDENNQAYQATAKKAVEEFQAIKSEKDTAGITRDLIEKIEVKKKKKQKPVPESTSLTSKDKTSSENVQL
jgi:hypothetical protein